jgi:acetyl-CoA acetyltransferase
MKNVTAKAKKAVLIGVGATPYYKRGGSLPKSVTELACEAILAAAKDAGINIQDVDGFAYYSGAKAGYGGDSSLDAALLVETLGIKEINFTAALTGGGGGSAGAIDLARVAVESGKAKYVVTVMALQQAPDARLGTVFGASKPTPESSFLQPAGMAGPGQLMALLAKRHMHLYGTRREAFAEIAISTRMNAINRPTALRRDPLTLEEYFSARMISDPLCLYDFCQESDGAVAVITTSSERASDLDAQPVFIAASAHGGSGEWGRAFAGMTMSDRFFATSGHEPIAQRLYSEAGVTSRDIDVALLYDHFTPLVLMQLEDYGFCSRGEGGAFVESGAIRFNGGQIPVNPHGGNLSEGYIIGMTHILEAVEQIRGSAINQVRDAQLALVTGGPASLPVSGLILSKTEVF